MTVTINKHVSVQNRFKVFLRLAGAFFEVSLSSKEIDILNEFYWESSGSINTDSRKSVADSLGITEYNLNNYLMKLRKKKIVTDVGIAEKLLLHVSPADRNFGIMFVLES